jgi:hypothetical protein
MAEKAAAKKPADATPEDEAWGAPKLMGLGIVALLCALSIIIFMGSRFEGCMYLDGSRPGHAIGR